MILHYATHPDDCWPHHRLARHCTWKAPWATVALVPANAGDAACLDQLLRAAETTRGALIAQPRDRGLAADGRVLTRMQVISRQAALAIADIIAAEPPCLGHWEPDA
jgi:hypothetical protein